MKKKKEILLLVASLTLSLVIIEIGLRAFTIFPIHGKGNKIAHPTLGYTLNPSSLSDIDASGFRNPHDKGQHEIVTIGDSHTQGFHVERDDTWPSQLGKSLGKSIYNYGVGGYGIFHYLYLAKEAAKHKPKYVLLGFYVVNDIEAKACATVHPDYYQKLLESGVTDEECSKKTRIPIRSNIRISQYSALLSVMNHLRKIYLKPIIARNLFSEKYFDIGGILINKKRVLKHYTATDLSLKIVNVNYEASKTILSLISNNLSHQGIKFGVVIIPPRELVIKQWARNNNVKTHKKFSVKPQQRLIDGYLAFLNQKGIPAIDSTPFVVEAFTKSVQIKESFYPSEDDHPLARGYESYSRAAAKLISNIKN